MHPGSGISWAPLHLKSSPCVSLGSNEAFSPASHWPTILHPAEPPPGCTHFSLCPGLFSCVLLCSAGYLSQEAVTAQLEFTWSFLLPCSLSKRVHLAFQPWRFSDTPLLLPKMETSEVLQKNSTFSCNLNQQLFVEYLPYAECCHALKKLMMFLEKWNRHMWNDLRTAKHNNVVSIIVLVLKYVTIVAPQTLVVNADIHRVLMHILFKPHNKPLSWVLLSPFYTSANWVRELHWPAVLCKIRQPNSFQLQSVCV